MRTVALSVLLASVLVTSPLLASPQEMPPPAEPHGLTIEEEAAVLAMEDRRAWDPELVRRWVQHPNSLHRARIALALGRIGQHAENVAA